jgi:predicted DNA-binding transcriptional regulator AlpA
MNANPFEILEAKLDALTLDVRTLKSRTHEAQPADEIGGIDLWCEVTGLSESTGYKKVHFRQVPHFKKAGRLYFRRSELEAWLDDGRRPMASEIAEERMTGTK